MGQHEQDAQVNHSAEADYQPAPGYMTPPTFGEESVHNARPAVPLQNQTAKLGRKAPAFLLLLAAGMAGGLLALFAITSYQRRSTVRTAEVSNVPPVATQDAKTTAETTGTGTETGGSAPARAAEQVGVEAGAESANSAESRQNESDGQGARQALHVALDSWLATTNARDVERHMNFYGPEVNAFYRARNASRKTVRAEKEQLFNRAGAIDVRADTPEITFARDGKTATMRFRKDYVIENGDGRQKSGAVLQELRWRLTTGGWKIVGERDVRVLR